MEDLVHIFEASAPQPIKEKRFLNVVEQEEATTTDQADDQGEESEEKDEDQESVDSDDDDDSESIEESDSDAEFKLELDFDFDFDFDFDVTIDELTIGGQKPASLLVFEDELFLKETTMDSHQAEANDSSSVLSKMATTAVPVALAGYLLLKFLACRKTKDDVYTLQE